jgi:MFS family permease
VRIALVAGVLVSIGLATGPRPLLYVPLIVVAELAYGVLFTPAFAMIADAAEEVGLVQGMAFGLMNAAWALGALAGPAAGGAIAGATGDTAPFLLAAALCGATLLAVRGRPWEQRRPAALVDRA